MSKDAYWFRHDSNASRDIKIMKLRAIHGWEGYGVFFGIIEILREQYNYKYNYNESDLTILCKIMDIDFAKLRNIITDCIKFGLLEVEDKMLFSASLLRRMRKWESSKENGLVPKTSEGEANLKPNESQLEANSKHKIRRDNIEDIEKEQNMFNDFRKMYGGFKRGNETEFKNLQRHKDWLSVLPLLIPAIKQQIEYRKALSEKGEFVADWKHLQTWVNKRSWEDETPQTQKIEGNGYAINPQEYIHRLPPPMPKGWKPSVAGDKK